MCQLSTFPRRGAHPDHSACACLLARIGTIFRIPLWLCGTSKWDWARAPVSLMLDGCQVKARLARRRAAWVCSRHFWWPLALARSPLWRADELPDVDDAVCKFVEFCWKSLTLFASSWSAAGRNCWKSMSLVAILGVLLGIVGAVSHVHVRLFFPCSRRTAGSRFVSCPRYCWLSMRLFACSWSVAGSR